MYRPRLALTASALVLATVALAGCGDDDSGGATTTDAPAPPTTAAPVPTTTDAPAPPTTAARVPTTTTRATTTTARPTPTTSDGGGGMQAGAPEFETFTVTSPVPCEDGNATTTMSFTTMNVVEIEIKIGAGSFEGTAGYGPNETAAVASIPCTGAGESTVQLRGCTEDDECVTSDAEKVTITG